MKSDESLKILVDTQHSINIMCVCVCVYVLILEKIINQSCDTKSQLFNTDLRL